MYREASQKTSVSGQKPPSIRETGNLGFIIIRIAIRIAGEPGSNNQMKCPFCSHIEDRVIDSRESKEGDSIRRRRQCIACEKRFTTYERIDELPYMVIKKDGRREKFDRQKVLNGLLKACEKRPISMAKLSDLVSQVEARVTDSPDREITTTEIGEELMDSLRGLDKIAYVRFASVYRDFQDEQAFLNELRSLTRQLPGGPAEGGGG